MHNWDTAGQERFRQIARIYYRDTQGILICFDVTNEDSFAACQYWLQDLEKHAPENSYKVLCGLKSDLVSMREVDRSKAEEFAKQNGLMGYFECSNRTGAGVEEMFLKLARTIHR